MMHSVNATVSRRRESENNIDDASRRQLSPVNATAVGVADVEADHLLHETAPSRCPRSQCPHPALARSSSSCAPRRCCARHGRCTSLAQRQPVAGVGLRCGAANSAARRELHTWIQQALLLSRPLELGYVASLGCSAAHVGFPCPRAAMHSDSRWAAPTGYGSCILP
jgi:hypothetical protein